MFYIQNNICYNTLGDIMRSVMDQTIVEYLEKKSRFIGILIHIENADMVNDYLEQYKEKYPGANHYVYAYIINKNKQKASDDGEPSRTAGYPVLDVLKKNHLNDCLAIVIRYFGGIKLGAGGLIRAYSKSISEAIKKATFIQKVTRYQCELTTTYPHLTNIERILREHANMKDTSYGENIIFQFDLYDHQFEDVKELLFQANQFEDHLKLIKKDQVYTKVSDSYIRTKK